MNLSINRRLLVMKCHYFFFFAAIGCLMPYLPAYVMTLGLSTKTVSIIYLLLPLTVIVVKPVFGNLSDHFSIHKLVFIISLMLMTVAYFSIAFIPKLVSRAIPDCAANVTCQMRTNFSNVPCDDAFVPYVNCTNDSKVFRCLVPCDKDDNSSSLELNSVLVTNFLKSYSDNFNGSDCLGLICGSHCESEGCRCDFLPEDFDSTNYVALIVCMLLSYMSVAVAIIIGDTLAYQMSCEENSQFGLQRVWGSIGWGSMTLIASFIFQQVGFYESPSINPVFFIFVAMCICDIMVSNQLDVRELPKPEKLAASNLLLAFTKPTIFLFTLAVFVCGVMTGALWTFQIVYIKELGGEPLLFGCMMFVQCFLGEIPFFSLSSPLLRIIGHLQAMPLCLCAFSLRFIGYSLLQNPWYILPLELTNGLCFGFFFAALVSFAIESAPPGFSATMQGILQSFFEGFGLGLGSLVSGHLYDILGGRTMFMSLGVSAAVFVLVYEVMLLSLPKVSRNLGNNVPTTEQEVEMQQATLKKKNKDSASRKENSVAGFVSSSHV